MSKTNTVLKAAVVCAAVGMSLLSMTASAKDVVKIAFVGPLTGGVSSIGLGGRNSADLAVRLRNADPKAKYTYQLVTQDCLLYTSPSPRDRQKSRMPSSA